MSTVRRLAHFRQLSLEGGDASPLGRKKSPKKATDPRHAIKVSLDAPGAVRLAWGAKDDDVDDAVVVKKCREVRRQPGCRLTRHASLEKDSILCSKQEPAVTETPKDEKPNLKIFLAPNVERSCEPPKLMQPLTTPVVDKNAFQIRKGGKRGVSVVVVPVAPQEIDVFVRPATASSRREKFKKRAGSAFHATIVDEPRAPLVRSSSAPSARPKFPATKRRLKVTKRSDEGGRLPNVEWKNAAPADVETMVELISPMGSDAEERPDEEEEARPASKRAPEEKKAAVKCASLRKAVKSVTFQQSSIHAIRSFSASFPARRASMASLCLGNDRSVPTAPVKTHEKRGTNSSPPGDETVPKRRLVGGGTDDAERSAASNQKDKGKLLPESDVAFSINIETKTHEEVVATSETDGEALVANTGSQKGTARDDVGETAKEKQCWDMYRKMMDKGIAVSYNTILRGMLTPTEYRLRRKSLIFEDVKLPNDAQISPYNNVTHTE
ncbi:uncharacterized protein LOC132698733 [Cylas formicarius]|uniref:uncharacterized protein LOC132698733 n=1 Tax=Cylas formicarius TaxID=197179 RepID=UPI0029589F86|nr:uncharacterized protein LOC132698733 [Cylas formicarius]